MVRVKLFKISTTKLSASPNSVENSFAPMEEFIANMGYDNVKNIVVAVYGFYTYYTIFYEDGSPYTPNLTPEKKGLFGQ